MDQGLGGKTFFSFEFFGPAVSSLPMRVRSGGVLLEIPLRLGRVGFIAVCCCALAWGYGIFVGELPSVRMKESGWFVRGRKGYAVGHVTPNCHSRASHSKRKTVCIVVLQVSFVSVCWETAFWWRK